jgi:tripartite-type tricarboxylate transporter receptor subunit TctC
MMNQHPPASRRHLIAAFHRWNFWMALAILACGCSPDTGPNGSSATSSLGNYPNRTITLICPWSAGGGTDRISRFMADQLQRRLGKPVVVVNRTGGSGAAGHLAGATAPPDGYTLTMITFELSTMHWAGISELTYEDFTPLLQLNGDAAALIVRADSPHKTTTDLVEYVRANPGKLKMSGTSTGGAWDLARAGFLMAAGLPIDSVLWVPTQGSAPSLVELLGGHIDAVCCSVPEAASQVEAGQLRVLGVMSPERLALFPDLPTVKEAGIEWEAVGWRGLALPKGADPAMVEFLRGHIRAVVDSSEFKEFMKSQGFDITARGPADFVTFLEAQDAQWKKVIEAAGYARP